jgi:hypothetical protein
LYVLTSIAAAPRIDRATYERLARRARLLSWLSLARMTAEGAVAIAIAAGRRGGLLGNVAFGAWWLDPVVGVLIAAVAV